MCVITQGGDSALIVAARYGHRNVVVELVKAKALLDLQNNVCFKINCCHTLFPVRTYVCMCTHV